MSSYVSGFSDLIEKYESYQKASGSWSENANGLVLCQEKVQIRRELFS